MNRRTFLQTALMSAIAFPLIANENPRLISLNFDDGPEPRVLKDLLPLLARVRVPATFFVIGEVAYSNMPWLVREHDAGHEIENHGWQHVKFTELLSKHGDAAVRASLAKTAELIVRATGRAPRIFRPPFWDWNHDLETVVRTAGYTMTKIGKPDINTLDYDDHAKNRPPSALVTRVKKKIEEDLVSWNRLVLVMHERRVTVEALTELIPYFQSRAYRFVRLDQIL